MIGLLVALGLAQAAEFSCANTQGAAPLEISCALVDPGVAYDEAVWRLGDGRTATGEEITVTYDEPGQYLVSVTLDGLAVDTGREPVERRSEVITACGVPEPAFTAELMGGLDYRLENHSSFVVGCVEQVQWTVREGFGGEGKVVLGPTEVWEPGVVLPEEGDYTIILNLGGVAGLAAAGLEVEARGGLPDTLRGSCTTTGSLAGGGGLWLVLGLLRRRAV